MVVAARGTPLGRGDPHRPGHRTVTGSVLTGAFCGRRANGGTNNRKSYYRLYFSASFDRGFAATGTWEDGTLTPGQHLGQRRRGIRDRRRPRGPRLRRIRRLRHQRRRRRPHADRHLLRQPRRRRGRTSRQRGDAATPTSTDVAADARPRPGTGELRSVAIGGGTRRSAHRLLHRAVPLAHAAQHDQRRRRPLPGHATGGRTGWRAGSARSTATSPGWDQYRAQIQLLALLEAERSPVTSPSRCYNFAQQNGGVWDRWVHVNGATHVMTGDPSAATLATFYAMGVRNFDVRGAFDSLVRQATVPNPDGLSDAGCPASAPGQRPNLAAVPGARTTRRRTSATAGAARRRRWRTRSPTSALADWAEAARTRRAGHVLRASAAAGGATRSTPATDGADQRLHAGAQRRTARWVSPFTPARPRLRPGHQRHLHLDGAAGRLRAGRGDGRPGRAAAAARRVLPRAPTAPGR